MLTISQIIYKKGKQSLVLNNLLNIRLFDKISSIRWMGHYQFGKIRPTEIPLQQERGLSFSKRERLTG